MSEFLRTALVQKLNGGNYSTWSQKVELLLIRDDLWEVIKDTAPNPVTAAWQKKDDKARATIGLLIEDNQLVHIQGATTAKAAWEKLKQHHQKSTLSSVIFIYKKLFRLRLEEGGDMENHVSEMLTLMNNLSSLGEDFKDKFKASLLLSSLPDSYNTLITSLESRNEADFTLDFVKGRVLDEYNRRRQNHTSGGNSGEAVLKTTYKTQNKVQSENKECFFCKKNGHYKKDCFKYKQWKIKQEKANKVSAHSESPRETIFMVGHKEQKNNRDAWYVDSGASSHMTNQRKIFTEFNPDTKGYVQLAEENKTCKVEGSGTAKLKCLTDGKIKEIKVQKVLYIPSLNSSLLSVKKLTARGYKVIFESDGCKILKDGKVEVTTHLEDELTGLYKLKTVLDQACTVINAGTHSNNCQHIWHRRFGHRNPIAIKALAEKGLVTGMNLKDCGVRSTCECCIQGKMARQPFPKETANRTKGILDLIHTDVCGPMQTCTPGKKRYILTLIDDYSRYTLVRFMEHKSEAVIQIKQFVEMCNTQFKKIPKCIRSDQGREYINKELQDFLKNKGIKVQFSTVYSPQQNGVAERKNRSLLEMARCMLIDAKLEKKFWAEAVNTANFLQNRLLSRAVNTTPYELWEGKKPDVSNLHVFGCEAYVQVPKEQRKKLDNKAKKLIFIGYSEQSKAYRLMDKNTHELKVSRDVIFLDTPREIGKKKGNDIQDIILPPSEDEEDNNQEEAESGDDSSGTLNDSIYHTDNADNESETHSDVDNVPEPRRSERTNRGVPPDRYMGAMNFTSEKIEDPRTVQEALSRIDKDKWKQAMDEEMHSLQLNDTWDLVPIPQGRDAITCKWVFKVKYNSEGQAEKYKARLVARGFSQKYGTDYDEVFAPVVRQATLKVLLTIAGKKNLKVKHYDAKTAFLNGELNEDIYMEQPPGYKKDNKKGMVCKLKKGLYGLKQAARLWNQKLNKILENLRFSQSSVDPCLYVRTSNDLPIYIIIHVDDFLIASKHVNEIEKVADQLKRNFQLTDLGFLQRYLGIEIKKNEHGFYCMKQAQYIEKIINRFKLQDAKISNIPLDTGYLKQRKQESPMEKGEMYQQLIGALLYLAVNTRPDISASVSLMSQYNKEPTPEDWTEVKRIVRYLKGTKDYELVLGKQGEEDNRLIGYADADWAENRCDRKSNSGYVFRYLNATISWGCRKQTCVALSSTEAEYIALAEACQEGIWLGRLIEDFLHTKIKTTTIYEDNQSCLKLIDNKKLSQRTKHIDTKFYFLKDLKEKGLVVFRYCPTEQMLADMFTKPLGKLKLKEMANKCGLS